MKASLITLGAVIAQVASAHYFFDTNIINGQAQPAYKYVRKLTRPTAYNPIKFSSNPAADIRDNSFVDKGDDIRCNQGAFASAGRTEVLTVNAGSEIRLKLAVGAKMQHPGPSLVYLSKAPTGSVKAYDGSGDWFKIFEEGVCNQSGDFTNKAWCSYDRDWIAATIPKDTPNGEYLARFEHIGVHRSHVNQPEHYVGCLQIKVQGGGNGAPGPMVKFPGAYKNSDPYAKMSIYNGMKPVTIPGPAVWKGGNAGGSTGGGAAGNTGGNTGGNATPTPSPTPAPAPAPAPAPGNGAACGARWAQCGGMGFTGATCCSQGKCTRSNDYYSQCL